jgi:predicted protein tyrosine phosphatase
MSVNLLFVCSRNQWRSPTGEALYRKQSGINARSAGTKSSARRRIRSDDITWADVILVMEDSHLRQIKQQFRSETAQADIHVLDIPDDYAFMQAELIDLIRDATDAVLKNRAT